MGKNCLTNPPDSEMQDVVRMYRGWNKLGEAYDRTDELVDYVKSHGEVMAMALLRCRDRIRRAGSQAEGKGGG